jgi:hypothetical protein
MIDQQQTAPNTPPWPVRTEQNYADNQGPGPTIKVRCIAAEGLYYGYRRRREGDVFTLYPQYVTELDKQGRPVLEAGQIKKKLVTAEQQLSPNTMERVEDDEAEHTTTAQQSLTNTQDELTGGRRSKQR